MPAEARLGLDAKHQVVTRVGVLLQKKYTDVQSLLTKVNLEGKVAIVTGGNIGLGFEIIKALVGCGAHVILGTRNDKRGLE